MMMENLVARMVLAGETKVLGKNLHRRHFVHHKSHLPDPGVTPGRLGGKPATNRFSYGADLSNKWLQLTTQKLLLAEPSIDRSSITSNQRVQRTFGVLRYHNPGEHYCDSLV
jgi:hypothetical protein